MTSETSADPTIEAASRIVSERTGLAFAPHRRGDVETAIRRAMARAGVGAAGYLAELAEGGAAFDQLVSSLVIGETYFFRDPGQFAFIRREAIPSLVRLRGPDHALRVWSAGCASGEEAYSLAILLEEEGEGARSRILATDISRVSLERAREAAYGAWSLRGADEAFIRRHFRREGDRYILIDRYRDRVETAYLNLALDLYPAAATGVHAMDLILCRNVLIYLDPATVARVARRLAETLAPGGWLITGASDPPLADLAPLQVATAPEGVFYRRGAVAGEARIAAFPGQLSALARVEERPPLAPLAVAEPRSAGTPPSLAASSAPPEEPADPLAAARQAIEAGDYAGAERLARARADDPAAAALAVRAVANLRGAAAADRLAAEATGRHPLSAELRYLRALLLLARGDEAAAAEEARRALYLDRSLAVGHFALGTILQRRGDRAGALRAYRNVEEIARAKPPDEPVPSGDGERYGRLAEAARAQAERMGSIREGR